MTGGCAERIFWGSVGLAALTFGVRAGWEASQTETGTGMVAVQWRDATLGWVSGCYEPVSSRAPAAQAEFWVQETSRILAAHPNDAGLTMGAAMMLDAPAGGYVKRYIKLQEGPAWLPVIPQLDYPALQGVEDEFELRCCSRCLDLAERACRLEPGETAWWQLRAVLQFRSSVYGSASGPRSPSWLEVLDECRQHDPQNGLYDYLAACQLWESSADLEFREANEYVLVRDAATFHRGVERFRRAQAKPSVSLDDKGLSATERFLRQSSVPRFDQDDLVNSRLAGLRRAMYLRQIWRWWGAQVEEKQRAGDWAGASACHRDNLRLLDQYRAGGPAQEYDPVAHSCRVVTTEMLQSLIQEHPAQFASTVLAETQRQATAARQTQRLVQAARKSMKGPGPPSALAPTLASLVGFAPDAIIVLLLVGVPCWLVGCRLRGARAGAIGAVGHSFAWLSALVITLVLFGLAPASVIPASVQAWVMIVLVVAGMTAALAYGVWTCLRKHRFQYSLRTFLLVILLSPLALLAVSYAVNLIDVLSPELHIPARAWENLEPRLLQKSVASKGEPAIWLWWSLVQWSLYHGAYLTMALWAFLVTLVILLRRSGDLGRRLLSRKRWSCLPRTLGKPATVVASLLLMAYLAVVPLTIRRAEADFQHKIAFARNPESHWTKLRQAVAAVRAEEAATKQGPSR